MYRLQKFRMAVLATIVVLSLSAAVSAEGGGLVSSMSVMPGSAELDGIRIRPAPELSGSRYTEDYGPAQVLEIIRPDGAAVKVGRLFSSCGCLRMEMAKREYVRGERALVEVRNVKPTVREGATYMLFIELVEPVAGVLQYDMFAKSERQ